MDSMIKTISIFDVLKRIPENLIDAPRIMKGLKYSTITDDKMKLSMGTVFEEAVQKNPNGNFILCEDTKITYSDANKIINKISHYYKSQGLVKGDVVAILSENSPEFILTSIGLSKLGVVPALINTSLKNESLTHCINLAKPAYVIAGETLLDSINDIRNTIKIPASNFHFITDNSLKTLQSLEHDVLEGHYNLIKLSNNCSTENPEETKQITMGDPIFYIYTSGSTGLPKAAILTQRRWIKSFGGYGHSGLRLNKNDVLYAPLPFYHATSSAVCLSCAIAGGAALAIRKKFSASNFWADVKKYQVTSIAYIGELCRYLINAPTCKDEQNNTVKSMIGNGLRPEIWSKFKKRFGIKKVIEFYASSEGNVGFANVFNFDNTIGYTPLEYSVIKYDTEKDEPVRSADGFMIKMKNGEPGLLITKVTKSDPFTGYSQKEKNEAATLRNVFEKGDEWFNTGDMVANLGYKHVTFCDRMGDSFRWKGENTSSTEIENITKNTLDVKDAVVYGVKIPNTDGKAGMMALVNEQNNRLDFNSLYEKLSKNMPHYSVPIFIRMKDGVDKTETHKYKKSELKKEGVDINLVTDSIHVLDKETKAYIPLTSDILKEINDGVYSF